MKPCITRVPAVLQVIVGGLLLTGLLLSPACTSDEGTPTPTETPVPTTGTPAPWNPDGIISAREYDRSETYGDYEVHWKSDQQDIFVGMRARASGFVAVAFQPGSRMKNADIVLGFVQGEQVSIFDMFSTGDFGPHPEDADLGGTDDVAEFGGREEGGFTTIEFRRALVTGDEYDNPVSTGRNQIIWSYSSSDSPTFRHSVRGYGELTL